MSRTAVRSETELSMRAEAHQIEVVVIRLAVDQDRIGTNMAVAMIRPGPDQGMIVIAPGENPFGRERGDDVRNVGVQRLRESTRSCERVHTDG